MNKDQEVDLTQELDSCTIAPARAVTNYYHVLNQAVEATNAFAAFVSWEQGNSDQYLHGALDSARLAEKDFQEGRYRSGQARLQASNLQLGLHLDQLTRIDTETAFHLKEQALRVGEDFKILKTELSQPFETGAISNYGLRQAETKIGQYQVESPLPPPVFNEVDMLKERLYF